MKNLFYLMIIASLFVLGCSDDGKKKFLLPTGESASVEGTAVVDDSGNVIVADNTGTTDAKPADSSSAPSGSSSGDSGSTAPSGSSSGDSGSTAPSGSSSGDSGSTAPAETTASTDSGSTPSGSTPSSDSGSTAVVPQGDPVDDLTGGNSSFAAYDVQDSGGIYWIKKLYKNGKSIFAWEFPPSITIKVQSIEPGAKVLVTFYGVYLSNETKVFYQYSAEQKPMKDIEVDESKWVIVGGKDLKYAYIDFKVTDKNGADITATTKAKINVHVDSSALTASLLKAKKHVNPFVMGTLIFVGLAAIVGINVYRRRHTTA